LALNVLVAGMIVSEENSKSNAIFGNVQ